MVLFAAYADLQINGTWVDVSSDVRGIDGTNAISITRGISSSGGMLADRGTCSLTLDNNSGKYSSRNPSSPYFGFLGRNTPIRAGVAYGAPWFNVPQDSSTVASTPDAAVLDVTGDIDIRVDAELPVWGDGANSGYTNLISKYGAAGQRSWFLAVRNTGLAYLLWTADGTNTLFASSDPLPFTPNQRGGIRVTLDVDNGAGGFTATFYTSTTAGTAGPWVQLGTPRVGTGTTSIFNSTAPMEIGRPVDSPGLATARKVFGAEVRNGISGTVVANPNFEAQTVGATSFADTAPSPRTWSTISGAVTNKYRRFVGEVSSWPPQWDTGGKDVTTPITASGILQRQGQGQAPLQSTLRRRVPSSPSVVAYWSMEEGTAATQAASPITGVAPMYTSGLTWAADSTLAGSGPLPQLSQPSAIRATVPVYPVGDWHVEMVYKLDTLPAAPTQMLQVNLAGGTAASVQFLVGVAVARVQALDATGAVLATADFTPNNVTDGWGRVQVKTVTSGGNVTLYATWIVIGGPQAWFVSTLYAGTPGRVASVTGTWGSAFANLRLGHLGVFSVTDPLIYDSADTAFDGETAAVRLARVASEQALPLSVAAPARVELVGPQPQGTLMDVLTAAAQADEGLLYEAREFLGLRYRGHDSLCGQTSALDLPYSVSPQPLIAPLTPVEDDQGTRNDSTVTRANGSSGRSVVITGPLSTLPPPAGVGVYDEAVTLNLHNDVQPDQHAGWRTHLGTWDEARFPQINVELAKNPGLIPAVSRVDTGSRVRITAPLPSWLPPDAIDQMVTGYTETFAQYSWRISFACTPYGPYQVAALDDGTVGRLDTAGSALAVAATTTGTPLYVQTTGGPLWINTAGFGTHFPFDVRIAGETITVTGITGAVEDSFTRTTSSSWGNATTGQAWTNTGGAAADFSTNGTTGRHSLTSVNVSRISTNGPTVADFDVTTSFSTSALAAGASHLIYLVSRFTGVNDFMAARVEFTTTATVLVTIRKRVAGTDTQLSTKTTALTHVAGTLFRLRFQGTGAAFQAKVWLAANAEPVVWDTTVTDASITAAGTVGVRSVLSTGNTNTLPVTAVFDDFALTNPQAFAVTRSANTVVKAQAAGSDVRLATPMILAL